MTDETRYDPRYTEQFERAMDLRREKRYEEAKEILASLWDKYPEERGGPLSWLLAGALLDLERPEEGIPFAQLAVQEAPLFFNASIFLLLCLWHANRHTEAFEEIVRFLSLKRSQHYEELVEGFLSESSELKEKSNYHELRATLVSKLSTIERYREQFLHSENEGTS